MISRIDLRGRTLSRRELLDTLPRAEVDVETAAVTVAPILAEVRAHGAGALRDLAERFDGVRPVHLRVPAAEIRAAVDGLTPDVRAAIDETIVRVRKVHAAQRPADFSVDLGPGAQVRQRWLPVRRVGLYVPGGLAVYPSSVIMNVVAAQEAGVGSLAVASPPQKDSGGLPNATILATCALLGVDDIDAGLEVVNAYGAEHLEIQTADAAAVADRVTSAGAIFVGPYSPVSLGDYMAGSNHVLPTGGCAHFTSGLGVHSFLRAVQVIEYDATALDEVADRIVAFAEAEGLPAHGEAVRARF